MGASESASPAGWPRGLKVQNSGYRDSQKKEGPTETALNWDASVYFLNCYLRNTRKAMTSHRWYNSGKQQDKETFWKRAEHSSAFCMTVGEPGARAYTVQALPWGKKSTDKNPQHKLNQENLAQHFRKKRCSTPYRKNFIIHQHHFLFQWLLGGWGFPEQSTFLLCLGHAVYPEGKNRQKSSENLNFSSRHIWPASTMKDFFTALKY